MFTELTAVRVVAVIPARGGSKGVPGKNLRAVGGVPLVVRAVRAAQSASLVDAVAVSSDDPAILAAAAAAGAIPVVRPAELSGDTASSESAVLHALETLGSGAAGARVEPAVVAFLQATSPFIDPVALDAAIARVHAGESDSVFSATPSHAFVWRIAGEAGAAGVNHDPAFRPRRQDREPEWRETGAFYVFGADGFRAAGHRFFGRIGIQEVDEAHSLEIDTEAELALAEALAGQDAHAPRPPAAPRIDAVVTDFDGVHTDDTAFVDRHGREFVRVHRGDGHGVRMLRAAGIPMLILSAERNRVVTARADKLGVDCRQGVDDKATELADWAETVGVPLDRIAYLGNDLPDLPPMRLAGLAVAVADAVPAVRAAADVVLDAAGGRGAVRALAELVLAARARPSAVLAAPAARTAATAAAAPARPASAVPAAPAAAESRRARSARAS